jgi:hypothetical protein
MATTAARAAMVAVAVATITSGRAVASPRDTAPLVLHVTDHAHLKTGELLEAERLAAGVYARIGVRIARTDGYAAGGTPDGALHLDVMILSAEMMARRQPAPAPTTFGAASREKRRAVIYSAHVINQAIQTSSDPSGVLALVLAHEGGHMLLPEYTGHPGPDCAHEPPMMRVRSSSDPTVTTLLHDAFERSATFRQLVEIINRTDGLVYIEPGKCKPGVYACLLMSVTIAGPNRVLHVRVDTRRDAPAVMGSIGHELQHAIEALSEAGVRTNALLHAFFERLAGAPSATGQLEFETEAAIRAGNRVRDESYSPTCTAQK